MAYALWIAFIFVSLNYQKHLYTRPLYLHRCCELLSFLYLWTIKSILAKYDYNENCVVNCFHFCIFELSKASAQESNIGWAWLWIAFIFVSLNYQKHQYSFTSSGASRCELLSFLYLWTIKSIFLFLSAPHRLLWIAFIFVSLNYQKHRLRAVASACACCELLSFLYLWTIKSIGGWKLPTMSIVVNCFHFCIFELSKASVCPSAFGEIRLWIAFIFVSLNYQKHHLDKLNPTSLVVNCFHFCIFELSKASKTSRKNSVFWLWIAFIFVSLNYQKHRIESSS